MTELIRQCNLAETTNSRATKNKKIGFLLKKIKRQIVPLIAGATMIFSPDSGTAQNLNQTVTKDPVPAGQPSLVHESDTPTLDEISADGRETAKLDDLNTDGRTSNKELFTPIQTEAMPTNFGFPEGSSFSFNEITNIGFGRQNIVVDVRDFDGKKMGQLSFIIQNLTKSHQEATQYYLIQIHNSKDDSDSSTVMRFIKFEPKDGLGYFINNGEVGKLLTELVTIPTQSSGVSETTEGKPHYNNEATTDQYPELSLDNNYLAVANFESIFEYNQSHGSRILISDINSNDHTATLIVQDVILPNNQNLNDRTVEVTRENSNPRILDGKFHNSSGDIVPEVKDRAGLYHYKVKVITDRPYTGDFFYLNCTIAVNPGAEIPPFDQDFVTKIIQAFGDRGRNDCLVVISNGD